MTGKEHISQKPPVLFFHRNPMSCREGSKLTNDCIFNVSDDELRRALKRYQ